MRIHVLDANALYRFLMDQPGAEVVERLFKQARDNNSTLLISVINWGEVYYNIARRKTFQQAQEFMSRVRLLPLTIVPADEVITEQAARLKAGHGLHYADCFAVVLAGKGRILVTADVKDFKRIPSLQVLALPQHKA